MEPSATATRNQHNETNTRKLSPTLRSGIEQTNMSICRSCQQQLVQLGVRHVKYRLAARLKIQEVTVFGQEPANLQTCTNQCRDCSELLQIPDLDGVVPTRGAHLRVGQPLHSRHALAVRRQGRQWNLQPNSRTVRFMLDCFYQEQRQNYS